ARRRAMLASPAPLRHHRVVTPDEPDPALADRAPAATRHDLQLGRRLFHVVNGVSTATAYTLFFTHEQVIHVFGTTACLVSVVGIRHGRRRIAHNRSLEGSLAFFGATVVIAALVLGLGADASPLAIAGASGTIALAAAGCELLPLRIDDNLTIPLFVGFATWIVAALFGVPLP